MSFGRVYTQNLADDFLALANVIAYVFDPASGHVAYMYEAFLRAILVERYERSEVLDVLNGADHELPFLGELVDL